MRRTGSIALVLGVGLLISLVVVPFHFSFFPTQTDDSSVSRNLVVEAQELFSPWNRVFGGSEDDEGCAIVEVSTGGFACVGYTQSSGAGYNDVWLVRTAADGSPQWSQTYGGTNNEYGRALLETSGGGLVIAGETYSFGEGLADMWLFRTDATGNLQWNQTYGGILWDGCHSLIEVSSGGLALGGYTDTFGAGSRDFWLLRTNMYGDHQWNQTYGGVEEDEGVTVLEPSGGGFAIAGWTYSIGFGDADVWVVRTDANGNLLWSQYYGGKLEDKAWSMIEVSTGGFLIVGGKIRSHAESMDVWLLRIDAFGNEVWNQTFCGVSYDIGRSVVELSTGGFCVAAETYSFGPGVTNLWLIGIDDDGNHLWNQTFGEGDGNEGNSIIEVSTGGFAVIGTTVGPGTGGADMWLLHVTTIGLIPPLSFEIIFLLVGTLIAVITIASVVIYRRKTARI